MKLSILVGVVLSATMSFSSNAVDLTIDEVTEKFKKLSGWASKVQATEQSPIDNFYQVIADGRVFYITKDGNHMFSGNLFNFNSKFVNLTEPRVRTARYDIVAERKPDLITYKAPNEKYEIFVFTDPTCGYCRKMHEQLPEYNALGITVNYIPYPRGGEKNRNGTINPVFTEVKNAWCSDDKKQTLSSMFSGGPTPVVQNCSSAKLKEYVQLGKKLGVSGTPAVVTGTGNMIAGYLDPTALIQRLGG